MGICSFTFLITCASKKDITFERKKERPGIRKHVKNIELRLGSVNFIWGSKSSILLPITLPLGLDFEKRVSLFHHKPLIFFHFIHSSSHRASDNTCMAEGEATLLLVTQAETKRAFLDGEGISRVKCL